MIALGGFMAVGKTQVGRALASQLDWPFVDLDFELEARFGPITSQFEQHGELVFRRRERDMLAELIRPSIVFATGGGAWVDPVSRLRLRRTGMRVVLHGTEAMLATRLRGDAARPLSGEWRERLVRRRPCYADAEVHVQVEGRSTADIVSEVYQLWRSRECG